MPVVVVISQHLLNVFVQLANKWGFKKKSIRTLDFRALIIFMICLVEKDLKTIQKDLNNL
jgi:hypothetical protein